MQTQARPASDAAPSAHEPPLASAAPAVPGSCGSIVERDHVHSVETEVSDLDERGLLKPHAYQKLFGRIAEEHLNLLGLNVETTLRHQLAWALVTMSLEIVRPVTGCIRLHATTWYSQRRGPYFRRELVFRTEDGEIAFHGSSFSVLLDVESRTVFRRKTLPFEIGEPLEVFTIEAGPALERRDGFVPVETRTVRNSHLDALGHVNNTRYGEFAHDALTEAECRNLAGLGRIDLAFVSELRRGDAFSVWKTAADERICVQGRNEETGGISFECHFTFRHPDAG